MRCHVGERVTQLLGERGANQGSKPRSIRFGQLSSFTRAFSPAIWNLGAKSLFARTGKPNHAGPTA